MNKVTVKGKILPVRIPYTRKENKHGISLYYTEEDVLACVVSNIYGSPIVILGKRLESCSKLQKLFIIMHEIGHIKHKHTLGIRSIANECEADSYACNYINKFYGLDSYELTELFSSINIKNKQSNEYKMRVKNIENYSSL